MKPCDTACHKAFLPTEKMVVTLQFTQQTFSKWTFEFVPMAGQLNSIHNIASAPSISWKSVGQDQC